MNALVLKEDKVKEGQIIVNFAKKAGYKQDYKILTPKGLFQK